MMNIESATCGSIRSELAKDPEQIVDGIMNGTRPVPEPIQPLVKIYLAHQASIRGCASYPRHIDRTMNAIYDALALLVEGRVI